MSEVQLHMDNKLKIRLLSVTFPDARNASVAFELYSDGHTMGPQQKPLLTVTQETSRYKLDETNLPDYNRIVESAAKKLESDFQEIVETLSKTYPSL